MPSRPNLDAASRGSWLALAAFSFLSFADACVRSLGGEISVFQISLSIAVIGMLAVPIVKPRGQTWSAALTMKRPWAVLARAGAGAGSALCGVYAFTHLPLPQAYGLIFLAPFLTTALAASVLRERVRPSAWLAIAIGFAGVLLIVRPGLAPLGWAHLAGVGTALCTAAGIVILRRIAREEPRTAILAVQMTVAAVLNGLLLLATRAGSVPAPEELLRLGGAAGFAFAGQLCLLLASSKAPADRIAPMQYFQLGWAVLLSVLLFREVPDAATVAGLLIIASAGWLSTRASAR